MEQSLPKDVYDLVMCHKSGLDHVELMRPVFLEITTRKLKKYRDRHCRYCREVIDIAKQQTSSWELKMDRPGVYFICDDCDRTMESGKEGFELITRMLYDG